MFVSAGWCDQCVANDLLFARAAETDQIFVVCAACGTAGMDAGSCGKHISDTHHQLAPFGWTLATRNDVIRAGLTEKISGDASRSYAELINWYPGFMRDA